MLKIKNKSSMTIKETKKGKETIINNDKLFEIKSINIFKLAIEIFKFMCNL